MRPWAVVSLPWIGLLLLGCAGGPAAPGPPDVRAEATGAGNSVEVAVEGRAVLLDIWSNRGTGRASVWLAGGDLPEALELRLHLGALEELRVAGPAGTTVVSVAGGPGHQVTQQRIDADGSEQPLTAGGPGWLPTRIVAGEPDPTFPLRDGHFLISLPPDLLAGGEQRFTLSWIDVFR